ncbi:hypothetical protein K8R43_01740 [archaeon]|nr:hypothetical protein [archaeon]
MEKGGIPIEAVAIVGGVLTLLTIVAVLLISLSYETPTNISQQSGDCLMRTIRLTGYDKLPNDAADASAYVEVRHQDVLVSPCSVNKNITRVLNSCLIGDRDSILLEVTKQSCNMKDIEPKEE